MTTTSSRVWTTDPNAPVALRIGETGLAAELPTTIGMMFKQTVEKFPDNPAMAFKEGESLRKISYKEYYSLAIKATKGFMKVSHVNVYVRACEQQCAHEHTHCD